MIDMNEDQLTVLELSKVDSFTYARFAEGFLVYEGFCNENHVTLYLEPNNEVGYYFSDIVLLPNISKKDLLNNSSLKLSIIDLSIGNE